MNPLWWPINVMVTETQRDEPYLFLSPGLERKKERKKGEEMEKKNNYFPCLLNLVFLPQFLQNEALKLFICYMYVSEVCLVRSNPNKSEPCPLARLHWLLHWLRLILYHFKSPWPESVEDTGWKIYLLVLHKLQNSFTQSSTLRVLSAVISPPCRPLYKRWGITAKCPLSHYLLRLKTE